MVWLFVAALLLGGGLVAMSLLGHHDGDGIDVDHGHHFDDVGLLAVFSLRNFTWASFAFGGIGLLGVLTQRSATTSLVSAIAAGLLTLVAVHMLFLFLRRSEAGDLPSDALVFGTHAQLVLPFNDAGFGTVSFRANGQVHEMPARRADEVAGMDAASFAECRIEFIENGIAVVQPASA
jgi:hypothetical protein